MDSTYSRLNVCTGLECSLRARPWLTAALPSLVEQQRCSLMRLAFQHLCCKWHAAVACQSFCLQLAQSAHGLSNVVHPQVEWVPAPDRATTGGVSRGFQSHADFARVKPLVAAPDPAGQPGVPPVPGALAGPCCSELHCKCLLATKCVAELYDD